MQECEFLENEINSYLHNLEKTAYEQTIPFKGTFELTPRCNFNCNMCYVHLKPDEIQKIGRERTKEEWIALAEAAKNAGVMELTLTGGEVFVMPDFKEIYEEIAKMGFLIQIFSNGYLLNEDTVKWLAKWPPKVVRFTLYGASDETYQSICGIPDGFSRVKQSVELLKQYKIPLYLSFMITKENRQEFNAMYEFAQENGLRFTHSNQLINPVRGASADAKAHQTERELPPLEIIKELRKRVHKYPKKPCSNYLELCGNYRRGFCITWNGNMQLCAFLSQPSIPVDSNNFMKAFKSLCLELNQLKQPKKCNTCQYEQYCDRCPGILYAEAGDLKKEAKTICERARYNYAIYKKKEKFEEDTLK